MDEGGVLEAGAWELGRRRVRQGMRPQLGTTREERTTEIWNTRKHIKGCSLRGEPSTRGDPLVYSEESFFKGFSRWLAKSCKVSDICHLWLRIRCSYVVAAAGILLPSAGTQVHAQYLIQAA